MDNREKDIWQGQVLKSLKKCEIKGAREQVLKKMEKLKKLGKSVKR